MISPGSSLLIYVFFLATCMMMMLSPAGASFAVSNGNNITCGPIGVVTGDGSISGAALAATWANDFRKICLNTLIRVTSSSSDIGAKKVCGVASAGTAVDIGILSRPFQPSEATTTDGYNFKCATTGRDRAPRTAIQVEAAIDAVVLVVAPNGKADYCIKKLFGNSLTSKQLRILYSSYPLETLVNTSAPTKFPQSSLTPDVPASFTPVAPSTPPNVNFPTQGPVVGRRLKSPTKKPSAQPTLPKITIKTISWGLGEGNGTDCSQVDALIAGPPPSSEAYQYFAAKILPQYGRGERVSPRYYSGLTTASIVSYVQRFNNAIAFLPLKDYLAYQKRVVAVNIGNTQGASYAPNTATLSSGLYPLGFNIYMEVRSDDGSTLRRARPFFKFAYSAQGDADVTQSGLVPVSQSSKKIMLQRLGVA